MSDYTYTEVDLKIAAIRARVIGAWDHPVLKAYGELMDVVDDILGILDWVMDEDLIASLNKALKAETIEEMREEVTEDFYRKTLEDSSLIRSLVEEHVENMSDQDVIWHYEQSGLGEEA